MRRQDELDGYFYRTLDIRSRVCRQDELNESFYRPSPVSFLQAASLGNLTTCPVGAKTSGMGALVSLARDARSAPSMKILWFLGSRVHRQDELDASFYRTLTIRFNENTVILGGRECADRMSWMDPSTAIWVSDFIKTF